MDSKSRQERLDTLEQQESDLLMLEDRLSEQLSDVARQLRTLRLEKAFLAPVNILPDDVLVQILELLYLHDFPHCGKADHDQLLHSPFTISHVSRHTCMCIQLLGRQRSVVYSIHIC